jgi:putative ABC transport system permease protein
MGDYFRTLEIPILEGRRWEPGETSVALVDTIFVRRFFPRGGALGRRISVQGRWYTVIGTVGSVRHDGYRGELTPQVYLSYSESPFAWPFLHLIARAPLGTRDALLAMDRLASDLPIFEVVEPPSRVIDLLRESVGRERFAAWVVSGFAALAALLALIGVFAVTSLLIVERTRELAIRFALGATPLSLARLVSLEGLAMISVGLLLGLSGALASLGLFRRLFADIEGDPMALVIAPLVMALGSSAAIVFAALRHRRRSVLAALAPDA